MTAIATRSGRVIDYLNPDPAQFCMDDIAAGLARAPRYCGQTNRDWSVLQHSLLVAHLVEPEHRLHALMHDAPEAYVCDIPSPMKEAMRQVYTGTWGPSLFSSYDAIEERVWLAICRRWSMEPGLPQEVKEADYTAMLIEARVLQPKPWKTEVWSEHRHESVRRGIPWNPKIHELLATNRNKCKAMWIVSVADELTKRRVAA